MEIECQNAHENIRTVNGSKVYSIDRMAQMKSTAYNATDNLRDLLDLAFIVNNYYHELSEVTLNVISDMLQYKGLEHLDYLLAIQQEDLVNPEKLLENFLAMHHRLNLIYSEADEVILEEYIQQKSSPKTMGKTATRQSD